MSAIQSWLSSGKDYIEGIRLYLQHGADNNLKRLFTEEQKTAYKETLLEKAMRDIAIGKEVVKEKEKKLPAKLSPKSWPAEMATTDVLKALREEWMIKYKTMQDLRSQLLHFPTDQERGEAAFKILELDAECDIIYEKRDYYNQHGRLPEVRKKEDELIIDPKKMYQRMEVLKRYIRRENKNIEKNPAHSNAIDRKQQWINEYNRYAKKSGDDLI